MTSLCIFTVFVILVLSNWQILSRLHRFIFITQGLIGWIQVRSAWLMGNEENLKIQGSFCNDHII